MLGEGITSRGCGKSSSLRGKVMGNLALGFTSPKRMLATASAPLLPAYHASSTPLTLSIQGMVTAVPDSITTIVCGFAEATWSIIASWLSGNDKFGRSKSSLVHWCANTIATSDCFARAAVAAGSAPEANFTLNPGALAATAFKGEVGNHTCSFHLNDENPGGSTCADPPPEIMLSSACVPIIATERTFARSHGNTPLSFFSSTMLCSATCREVSSPRSTSTTLLFAGKSTIPLANSERKTRRT